MEEIGGKYINPLTDFGFKRLFGSEFNKELLISFLNTLLDGEQEIVDVTSIGNERAGHIRVTCTNATNEEPQIRLSNNFVKYHITYDNANDRYAEIAKFSKSEHELLTMSDKWMFALKNLVHQLNA